MKSKTNKKVIVLGASCFFEDAYKKLQQMGYFIVSIDYYDDRRAICRKYADKVYRVSTLDYEKVRDIAIHEKPDVVYAGASEVNIPVAIRLSEELGIDYYCGFDQWKIATNKKLFKEMCQRHGLDVTEYYLLNINDKNSECKLEYPVVTKPIDSSGSRGVSICHDKDEFLQGVAHAFSETKASEILVEKYITFDSVMVHYTIVNGKAYFCGMSDKKSRKISSTGGPIMSSQLFPSKFEDKFLSKYDAIARNMYEQEGFRNGPVWIEMFSNGEKFLFNEMGYRFEAPMTYLPVKFYYGIDQMELLIESKSKEIDSQVISSNSGEKYAIVPIHILPGKIKEINGLEESRSLPNVHAIEICHVKGDEIEASGTVLQTFCYVHIVNEDTTKINETLMQVKRSLSVKNFDNKDMLMEESVSF